jgi:monoamine oxidase
VTAIAEGSSVTARRAIVAIPPPLAARIDYSPQLPALRDQLTQRMPMGTVMKVHAVYP